MSASTHDEIYDILSQYKTIAVVGLSAQPDRPSHGVAKYLLAQGYDIIPVTPTYEEVFGIKAYPSLLEIPKERRVEVVDIFRRPHHVPEIVDQAIAIGAKVVWMQLGIVNREAAEKARAHGLLVVMNSCIKIEHTKRFT